MITCENCIYFKNLMAYSSDKGIGKCIRNAPLAGDVQTGGAWPFVYYDQACGEFVSKTDGSDYTNIYEFEDETEYP